MSRWNQMGEIRAPILCLALLAACCAASPALASSLRVPPEAKQGLDRMYGGDLDAAIAIFRGLQQSLPDSPLGYLLEADARWWKIYCAACEFRWGMIDAWKRSERPEDVPYLALADKGIHLAEAQLARGESAELHFYAGMGYALQARLYGLRFERRATAHAGVKGREHLLRAAQLDPNLADAYAGLGLYNYYVDTLSPIVKVLRFFMGIPGGSRAEGLRQLQTAAEKGELTGVEARFYLAKCLRNYDQKYEQAVALAEPLVRNYPHNSLFLLLEGNLLAELGRKEKAAASYRAAGQLTVSDPACVARVQQLVQAALAALR
jgi:tetratricopeptide (TPR) repeat protein